MADTAAVVLCGGRSSRMGRAKALLPWRGRPMVAHVVDVLRSVVDDVVVVTSADLDPPSLDARIVRDEEPGLGPLAGLAAGLAATRAGLAYATSTDAPFLSPAFVRAVLASGGAAAPISEGHVQVLAAAYPAQAGAREALRLIEAGRRRPLDLLEALDYRPLECKALPDTESLESFNTPAEYLDAVRREQPGARCTLEFVGHVRTQAGCESLEAPIGTLGEVLGQAPAPLDLCRDGRVIPAFLVSLDGRDFVRTASLPVGPNEHVVVLDSAAGG